jgi:hypothetical protein
MKLRGSAILLSALGAFCGAGVALGQAPSQGLRGGEPLSDPHAIAIGPAEAQNATSVERQGKSSNRPEVGHGNPLWAIPLESLRNTRERPLFSASRRPPPPVVAEAPRVSDPAPAQPAAPEKPQITLVGVVHGLGVQMGVFVDETDKSVVRLRVGQSVRGWTLHDVDPRATTLKKAEEQVKLELPGRDTETAATTSPAPEDTASLPQQGLSGPLHGVPVGRIKPFATADR